MLSVFKVIDDLALRIARIASWSHCSQHYLISFGEGRFLNGDHYLRQWYRSSTIWTNDFVKVAKNCWLRTAQSHWLRRVGVLWEGVVIGNDENCAKISSKLCWTQETQIMSKFTAQKWKPSLPDSTAPLPNRLPFNVTSGCVLLHWQLSTELPADSLSSCMSVQCPSPPTRSWHGDGPAGPSMFYLESNREWY